MEFGCRVLFSVDPVFEIAFFHSKDTGQLCGDGALDILLVAEPRVAHNMGEGNPLADAALEHIPEHLVFFLSFAMRQSLATLLRLSRNCDFPS